MGTEADALAERMVESVIATAEVMTVYLGDRLGLYAPLAEELDDAGRARSRDGHAERYARERLEQQAVAGFLEVGTAPTSESHRLPAKPRSRCWSTATRRPNGRVPEDVRRGDAQLALMRRRTARAGA